VDATGSGSRLNLQKVRASQNMQCSSIENRIYEPHNMNIVHIGRKREPQCVAKSRGWNERKKRLKNQNEHYCQYRV
jgi:hypothetical protein